MFFRVEQFGSVRPHQSYALNFHLFETVVAFDREYMNARGVIRSFNHVQDRNLFASDVAKCLLNLYRDDDGDPLRIETKTRFKSGSLGKVINVRSTSTFSTNSEPEYHKPSLPGAVSPWQWKQIKIR